MGRLPIGCTSALGVRKVSNAITRLLKFGSLVEACKGAGTGVALAHRGTDEMGKHNGLMSGWW